MVRLEVEVAPRSRRPGVSARRGDVIKVRVAAAPAEGRANDELVTIIAAFFDVPKSAVTIKRGASGKRKLLEVEGLSVPTFNAKMALIPTEGEI